MTIHGEQGIHREIRTFNRLQSGSLLVMIGGLLAMVYKGAQSAPEVTRFLGPSVALVQRLVPVALGQDSTEPTVLHKELCSMLCGSLDGRRVWGRMDTCVCVCG